MPVTVPVPAARGCGGSALLPAAPRQVRGARLGRGRAPAPPPFPPRALDGDGGVAAARCPRAAGLWADPCGRLTGVFSQSFGSVGTSPISEGDARMATWKAVS